MKNILSGTAVIVTLLGVQATIMFASAYRYIQ